MGLALRRLNQTLPDVTNMRDELDRCVQHNRQMLERDTWVQGKPPCMHQKQDDPQHHPTRSATRSLDLTHRLAFNAHLSLLLKPLCQECASGGAAGAFAVRGRDLARRGATAGLGPLAGHPARPHLPVLRLLLRVSTGRQDT